MIIIEILHFDNYLDVASTVSDKYEEVTNKDKLNSIDIIAKYEDAKEILRRLIIIGYNIACIDINDVLTNNYIDEYIISLYESEVWCEPAKRDGEYVSIEDSGCVYLLDNCNSKLIHKIIDANEIYEVEIGEYDDCDGNCENCHCNENESYVNVSEDEDGNQHGFTASRSDGDSHMSYSFYTTEDLSEDDIHKMLKAFGF